MRSKSGRDACVPVVGLRAVFSGAGGRDQCLVCLGLALRLVGVRDVDAVLRFLFLHGAARQCTNHLVDGPVLVMSAIDATEGDRNGQCFCQRSGSAF